jgi:signal transduction histidine kinase
MVARTQKRLRVLVIEDEDDDFTLLCAHLRRSGYEIDATRVDTEEDLRAALARPGWDAIISDYSLPTLDAPSALAVVKEAAVDIPFIIVSGTVNEDIAVSAMRAGAHDFMSKNRLARLVPALERELRDAAGRRETVRLREELVLADRMASVGALAAGVAHEINNPLAAVLANLEFARAELEALGGDRATNVRATLVDACEAAQRVRFIVRDLKVFSRASDEDHGPVDVHEVLESTLRMAKSEVRHRARLVRDYADVPPVRANAARLGQVFLNLVVNAAQAIAEGSADTNEIRVVTRREGKDRVAIEVHDTGEGIPPEVAGRIFDPFFTTKPIGTGTGLGLAICHRIVSSLQGEISVTARPDRGMTFRVVLPVGAEAPTSSPPASATERTRSPEPPRVEGQRAKVAVVDDDVMITTVLRRILGAEHSVTVATPTELLAGIARGERFDVVLCDLMMPDITGDELHRRIEEIAPELTPRVIFMTGGAVSETASAFLARVPNPRVAKPFENRLLRELVRSVASGKEAPRDSEVAR